jgi:hypothetical protein
MKWSYTSSPPYAVMTPYYYKSNKMVRSEGLGSNPECNMSGKIY